MTATTSQDAALRTEFRDPPVQFGFRSLLRPRLHLVLREVGASGEEFADEVGEVGGVGCGACDGAQSGDAGPDLVVPVGEQVAGGGMEEEEAGQVALGLVAGCRVPRSGVVVSGGGL
jgi:hypothetical protein